MQSQHTESAAPASLPLRPSEGNFTDSRSEEVAQMHKTEAEGGRRTLPERIMQFLSKVSPVRKISDEEYLAILDKQKAELERSMAGFAGQASGERQREGAAAGADKSNTMWASLTSGFSPAEPKLDVGQVVGELEGIDRKMEALRIQIDKKADRAKVV